MNQGENYELDPKVLKQIIEKDQPELNKILEEYI